MQKAKAGFTLIELLVVVLIIGILAAVAVPQYQKAVEKSHSVEAITLLKSVYQSAQTYYLENGNWPQTFEDLSILPPWTENASWYTNTDINDTLSNHSWALQILESKGRYSGLNVGRTSGPYAGGGFALWNTYNLNNQMPINTIVCAEKISVIKQPGNYCQKIIKSGDLILEGSLLRYYTM